MSIRGVPLMQVVGLAFAVPAVMFLIFDAVQPMELWHDTTIAVFYLLFGVFTIVGSVLEERGRVRESAPALPEEDRGAAEQG